LSIDFFSFEVDYFSGDTSERSLLTYRLVQRLGAEQLRLYLDLDDFYLDPAIEVSDTIQPDYMEIPITAENGLPSGTYDFTWVATVDDYNLQSRVTIELKKR